MYIKIYGPPNLKKRNNMTFSVTSQGFPIHNTPHRVVSRGVYLQVPTVMIMQ